MTIRHSVTVLTAAALILAASLRGAIALDLAQTVDPTPQQESPPWTEQSGEASYYASFFHGRRAADGSRFDQMAMTAAHHWLPFGTKVRVTLSGSSRSVIVTITDRIFSPRRILDLSPAAARQLGITQCGVAQVTLVPA
jgi:rare lipoprotein A